MIIRIVAPRSIPLAGDTYTTLSLPPRLLILILLLPPLIAYSAIVLPSAIGPSVKDGPHFLIYVTDWTMIVSGNYHNICLAVPSMVATD